MKIEGFGYRHDLEDRAALARDAHPFRFGLLTAAQPKPFNHRSWNKTCNQGPMGSCAGHATHDAQKVLNYYETGGQIVEPSRMLAYLLGQKCCGLFGSDSGSTIWGVVQGGRDYGNCLEKFFPYPDPVRYSTQIPAEALQRAGAHKWGCFVRITGAGAYDQALKLIATRMFAVLIGVGWTERMARGGGVIEDDDVFDVGGRNPLLGGHANCVQGISERRDRDGRFYLEDHNSHGVESGQGGWFEIAPSCFDHWGRGAGPFPPEMIAVSKLTPWEIYRRLNWVEENVL